MKKFIALILSAIALTGCSASADAPGRSQGSGAYSSSPAAAPQITVSVPDGATAEPPDTPLRISATKGTLVSVQVAPSGTQASGAHVAVSGTLDAGRRNWTPGRSLSPATTYTVHVTAAGSDGQRTTTRTKFTTATPSRTNRALLGPLDNQVVGVGMPVTLRFDHPVINKAAVEKQLSVTTAPTTEGSWGWVRDPHTGQERVDWRPAGYWRPGTKVTVKAALSGIDTGGGRYLPRDISTTFAIGTTRIARIDLDAHRMVVTENGRTVRNIPVSGGGPETPTHNGTMVVMDKVTEIRMNSETVGLGDAYNMMVKWAVHLTTSGTYVHAAPWNSALIGNTNASHGCIGMNTGDARWFYSRTQPGDIVITTGSAGAGLSVGNGLGDWNLTYKEWKKRSAV
ncbi:Ig-like domain-containing protein [Streptomyces sp. TX20-6-3]|uniref:L,D-transpeptidase n=1 Tax=Streptomyces sp. TX20-6-3 TaxID=3028705 RepID=UPI0029BD5032|nr:Ig-like domain-containing protein [Streptomyces sp. TX20-6-3]MDX2565187.1 Ig-like domain-containing protein [Streptomyces sp. TX20-6-3]